MGGEARGGVFPYKEYRERRKEGIRGVGRIWDHWDIATI